MKRPPPKQSQGRAYVVKNGGGEGALRARWVVNWLILVAGLLMAASFMLGGSKGEAEKTGAVAFGLTGATLGYFLYSFGSLVVVIMAILAMANGAVGRAFLMLLGHGTHGSRGRRGSLWRACLSRRAGGGAPRSSGSGGPFGDEAARKESRSKVAGILSDAEPAGVLASMALLPLIRRRKRLRGLDHL